jgi:hypothetical protein
MGIVRKDYCKLVVRGEVLFLMLAGFLSLTT